MNQQREKRTKVRWMFAGMFFLIGVIAYMDRANISYIATPMMEDLNLSKTQFGFLASFFSLGYALMQVPSGFLAEKFGPKRMLSIALVWWSAFTIFTGLVKNHGFLYFIRFLFGVGEAPMYPSNAVFNTFWFSKTEKGRASSALLAGSYFGPVIAPFITIAIYNTFGWQAVFFIFGAVGFLIAILWAIIAKDLPEHHKMVNEAEKLYIMENRDVVETEKSVAPWGRFFARFSFYAIAAQYFVVQFVITIFLYWYPTYLIETFNVDSGTMSKLAGIPWLVMFGIIMAGGIISDSILGKGKSRFVARALLAIAGFVLCGIALFLAVTSESLLMNIIWMSLCLAGVGLSMVMSWASATDIGRNFSGSVTGWMNLWGNIGAMLSPIIIPVLEKIIGWEAALLSMLVLVVLAIVLWFFVRPDHPLVKDESEKAV
ncbi:MULTISPECIES: MFS transporter [Staphylococcus]|uniref:MFS transporter n=1 Tax=Staphylococcus TaxID=1279 RepID=UPI000D1A44C1|nr:MULTISPECIES: MFS transporter [Staphylococcus]MDT0655398.1 MFS transporter [Staphylococcus chromogenes]MDT0680050.1 MFS transporter [Staphylococcus chromogenes]MDT0698162.1 MFS transporter [Staphylococcus chromogenes]MDY3276984.1 MFS transporter [Staphylococcus chromogenes]NHM78315.1 MFS transporter [Staphylococcus sp. 11511212]